MPNLKYKDFLKQKLRIMLLSFQPANWISKDCTGKLKTKKKSVYQHKQKIKIRKVIICKKLQNLHHDYKAKETPKLSARSKKVLRFLESY